MSEYIEVIGKVIAVLPGTMFRVELQNKHVVLAHISGKLRKNFIKLMVGDIVKMEMSPQDLQKARIIFRMKNAEVQKNTPIHSFGPRSRGCSVSDSEVVVRIESTLLRLYGCTTSSHLAPLRYVRRSNSVR